MKTLKKNGNTVGTIYKAGTLLYISAFWIVPTLLLFFVQFWKWNDYLVLIVSPVSSCTSGFLRTPFHHRSQQRGVWPCDSKANARRNGEDCEEIFILKPGNAENDQFCAVQVNFQKAFQWNTKSLMLNNPFCLFTTLCFTRSIYRFFDWSFVRSIDRSIEHCRRNMWTQEIVWFINANPCSI